MWIRKTWTVVILVLFGHFHGHNCKLWGQKYKQEKWENLFNFAVIIVNPKLLREKGTEARFPISLPCTRLLLLLPVFPFHLVVDGFVYLEISSVLLQNKLKLTDSQTEVFCLNSRLYSGTSFFYRITVSSFSKKKK